MFGLLQKRKAGLEFKAIAILIAIFLLLSGLAVYISRTGAGRHSVLPSMPLPGELTACSDDFAPAVIRGIMIDPKNPLRFSFIVDGGDARITKRQLKEDSTELIKYFLAALTIPEEDLWVNLSPYESERVIPGQLAQTGMGRDLLAQDYLLKQLAASLTYPESKLGREFWERVYAKAKEEFGAADIPVNTFNKVWIVPDKAVVHKSGKGPGEVAAFIVESRLKVMLETDYLAYSVQRIADSTGSPNTAYSIQRPTQALSVVEGRTDAKRSNDISLEVTKEIILPAIEKEINKGKNFAKLRQIYNSIILAIWFKRNLKQSLLSRNYFEQEKIAGIDIADKTIKEKIYNQYLDAYKRGVYNYVRHEFAGAGLVTNGNPEPLDFTRDKLRRRVSARKKVRRRYFSGGFQGFSAGVNLTGKDVSWGGLVRDIQTYGQGDLWRISAYLDAIMAGRQGDTGTRNAINTDRQARKRRAEKAENIQRLEREVEQIDANLMQSIKVCFDNYGYGTLGIESEIDPLGLTAGGPVNSLNDFEHLIRESNVYWPLFSRQDKIDVLNRIREFQDKKAAEYIEKVIKAYIMKNYGLECTVEAIFVNGSSVYRWSCMLLPADFDAAALIQLDDPDIVIREKILEIPDVLKNAEFDILGMSVQSVNSFNLGHPHTRAILTSIHSGGIPLLERRHRTIKIDRKNNLFQARELLEDGRMRLSASNADEKLKWFNRLVEVKAILYRLGLLEKFNHHRYWEKFDNLYASILSEDSAAVSAFMAGALREYFETKDVIEGALLEEKKALLQEIVEGYRAQTTVDGRREWVAGYTRRLARPEGAKSNLLDSESCRSWSEKVVSSANPQALKREHLALLDIGDPTIDLLLRKNSPFPEVQNELRQRGAAAAKEESSAGTSGDFPQIISYGKQDLPRLIDLIYGEGFSSKRSAVCALGEIGSARAVPFIIDACSRLLDSEIAAGSSQEGLLNAAIEALGKCNSEKAVPFLFGVIGNGSGSSVATASNIENAIEALDNLCDTPAISFAVAWKVRKFIRGLSGNGHIPSADRSIATTIRILKNLPIDRAIKQDLVQPLAGSRYSELNDLRSFFGNVDANAGAGASNGGVDLTGIDVSGEGWDIGFDSAVPQAGADYEVDGYLPVVTDVRPLEDVLNSKGN